MLNLIILLAIVTVSVVKSQNCGGIYTQERIIIESPNYPSSYPQNFNCSYTIKGPVCATHFHLQFLDFNLEASVGCTKDRLEVLDKDAICGTKTGEKSYRIENGVLHLKFLSDFDGFGRGFRILITRMPCENASTFNGAFNNATVKNLIPQTPPKLPSCCQNRYSSKHFYIASPGFPFSNKQPNDCVYTIYKANQNVCRLRIHFKFYLNGEVENYRGCINKGYLQIDGKFICGCKIGLKLISPFEPWSDSPKLIRFKNEGYPRSAFSGFALEIIQDECPKRYSPAQNVSKQIEPNYNNDQINNRVAWLNSNDQNLIGKARLISEDTEVLDDVKRGGNYRVLNHFYVFEEPEYYNPIQPASKKDREETTYTDTSSIERFLPNDNNYECRSWGLLQYTMLTKEYLWQNMVSCKTVGSVSNKCVELNSIRGHFQSPGYPYYYPQNLNICYRFKKLPGFCSIKMTMWDFDLENSYGCRKDYFLLSEYYRYCGQRLLKTASIFDLRQKQFEEAVFITDSTSCGRGFKGFYDQIPCQDSGYLPPTFDPPSTTTPTLRPLAPCNRVIRDSQFTVDVRGNNQASCRFDIIKSSPRVCRLVLKYVANNLNCQSESFTINNRQYCGMIENGNFYVDFYDNSITMHYQRMLLNQGFVGLRFRLNGVQSEDCGLPPEVQPERQISLNLSSANLNKNAIRYDQYPEEICGMVVNATEIRSPETLCELLMERQNVKECLPIGANSIYVPFNNNMTLELRLLPSKTLHEGVFNKIYCNEVPYSS